MVWTSLLEHLKRRLNITKAAKKIHLMKWRWMFCCRMENSLTISIHFDSSLPTIDVIIGIISSRRRRRRKCCWILGIVHHEDGEEDEREKRVIIQEIYAPPSDVTRPSIHSRCTIFFSIVFFCMLCIAPSSTTPFHLINSHSIDSTCK